MFRRTLIKSNIIIGIIITTLALSHCGNNMGFTPKHPYATKNSNYYGHKIKQDDVWSCHAFCAIGLLEAAYKQQYNKKVNLSEADVMIRHLKGNHKDWDSAFKDYLLSSATTSNPRHLEAGKVTDSFRIIQRYGVATEKEVGYESGMGFPLAIRVMRQNFDQTRKLIKSNKLSRSQLVSSIDARKVSIIKNGNLKYFRKAERPLASRAQFRNFANQFRLVAVPHKMSRSQIKELVKRQPIGVQFSAPGKRFSHIVIFEKYHPETDSFSIRNSDTKFYFSKEDTSPEVMIRQMDAGFYLIKK